jgi:hypothetical protein
VAQSRLATACACPCQDFNHRLTKSMDDVVLERRHRGTSMASLPFPLWLSTSRAGVHTSFRVVIFWLVVGVFAPWAQRGHRRPLTSRHPAVTVSYVRLLPPATFPRRSPMRIPSQHLRAEEDYEHFRLVPQQVDHIRRPPCLTGCTSPIFIDPLTD